MDVLEAINSRIACRQFLDKPVDPALVRKLIESAGRAASNSNLQPWHVHALTGEPLQDIKRQCAELIAATDWHTLETEYSDMLDSLWGPYLDRKFQFGVQLYGALGINRENRADRMEQIKRNYRFFDAPVGLFITIDRRLGPSQWADLGGYVNVLALLARAHGLDTCPQIMWNRMYKVVGATLKFPAEQMLYCGISMGYGDRSHAVNSFRTARAELGEFCKFYGFD